MWLGLLSLVWASEVRLTVETRGVTLTQTTESRLSQTLGRVLDFYEHGLHVGVPDTLDLEVLVVGDADAFRALARQEGMPDWAGGFFVVKPGSAPMAVLWGQDDKAAMMRVFLHEGSHYLLGYGGRSPRWLNEGLAQCFENSRLSGNALTIHPPAHYTEVLARTDPPDVRALIGSREAWNDLPASKVGPRYIHAWALTAFLMSSTAGHETLAAILRAHKAEPSPDSAIAAIEATWRGGVDGLQSDLARWVKRPPASVMVPRFAEFEQKTDALWTTCPDGRLVSTAIGCN